MGGFIKNGRRDYSRPHSTSYWTLVAAVMENLSKYFADLVHTRTLHNDKLHQSMDKRKSGVSGMSKDRTLPTASTGPVSMRG